MEAYTGGSRNGWSPALEGAVCDKHTSLQYRGFN